MIKLSRFAKFISIGAASALLFAGLAACSHKGSFNAKQVLMACLAVTNVQAGKILGGQLDAMMLSGENSPIHVCEYNDSKNQTLGLLQITGFNSKDPAAELAADAAQQKALFKQNIDRKSVV